MTDPQPGPKTLQVTATVVARQLRFCRDHRQYVWVKNDQTRKRLFEDEGGYYVRFGRGSAAKQYIVACKISYPKGSLPHYEYVCAKRGGAE